MGLGLYELKLVGSPCSKVTNYFKRDNEAHISLALSLSHNSNCKLGNTVHCENDMSHFHDMTWSKKTPDSIFPNSFVSKGKL